MYLKVPLFCTYYHGAEMPPLFHTTRPVCMASMPELRVPSCHTLN